MDDLIKRDAAVQTLSDYAETQQDLDYYRDMLMKIPAVNRWIPVEDDLPEEDVSVMCYMRIGEIVIMEYVGDGWYSGIARYNPRAVTHWMPLPEPPESEVQE